MQSQKKAAVQQNSATKLTAFFKNVRTLSNFRAHSDKLNFISGNAFIIDIFALGGEKESKYDQGILFLGSTRSPDLFLNMET